MNVIRVTGNTKNRIDAIFTGNKYLFFSPVGFCWSKRLERSTHYKYFLKPGSVTNESVSSAVGRFTGYGS